jgi:hypothetical protein
MFTVAVLHNEYLVPNSAVRSRVSMNLQFFKDRKRTVRIFWIVTEPTGSGTVNMLLNTYGSS